MFTHCYHGVKPVSYNDVFYVCSLKYINNSDYSLKKLYTISILRKKGMSCMAKKLYEFHWDCGRMGDVEGLFIAEEETVKEAIGKDVYFGEILGKHSDVHGTLDEGDLTVIDIPSFVVDILAERIGWSISGYNPLDYIYDEEED